MSNMRIGARLLLAFGIVVALSIIMGLFGLSQLSLVQSRTKQMEDRDFATLDNFRGINRGEDQMRATREMADLAAVLLHNRMAGNDPMIPQRQWFESRDRNLALLARLQSDTAEWERSAVSERRASMWGAINRAARESEEALRALSPVVERHFRLVNEGRIPEALSESASVERVVQVYQAKLAEAQKITQEQILAGRAEVAALGEQTRRAVLFAILVTAFAGILFAILIHRSITRPLQEFMRVVETVGQGDLTGRAPDMRRDEIGDLGRTLNRMVLGLRDVATQTRAVAENLNAATAEILASTQQQAASTAEQAAAVQQANATMAEISQSGAQISDRARDVAATAEATSSASASGLESVQNTTAIMERIREQAEAVAENVLNLSEKTQAVGEIISSVNDISEQSQLLALNAAIQAAAAGENGRAFSVVANEMKNLAGQSKQATVQVRSILGDIQKAITSSVMLTEEAVKRVEAGRQQAEVADRAIRELTDNIEESVRAFQQIVGGSGQQRIGFEQVTQAFRSIGIASQETANSTKQSEKAAANLNALAQQLRSTVERYKV